MSAWVITSLIIFLGVCLYRREWGVYLVILGLPAYQIRFNVFGIPATFLEGMILILAGIELVSVIRNRSLLTSLYKSSKSGLLQNVFIFFFLLAAFVSVYVAPDTIKAAGVFKAYFFEAVLFYFLARLIIDSREKFEKLLRILALLVLYLSIFGIYQYLTLQNLPPSWWDVGFAERRIVSLLNHPNGLALVLGPLLAMLILLPKDKLQWAAIIFGLPAFYLTFSRAGWLALTAILGVAFLFGERSRLWKLLIPLGIMILILAIPISRTKLTNLVGADPSKENRYVLWSAAADMLKQHPITGVGLMGFRQAYKNYPLGPDHVIQNYPHNFFLTFWVETGLLGLLSIIALLILFYKKIRTLMRSEYSNYALATGAAMSMIILHSLVDVSYFKNDLSVLFWLVYSLPFLEPST